MLQNSGWFWFATFSVLAIAISWWNIRSNPCLIDTHDGSPSVIWSPGPLNSMVSCIPCLSKPAVQEFASNPSNLERLQVYLEVLDPGLVTLAPEMKSKVFKDPL